ncbi:MAG: CvpA family protein [Desulfomonilaceae bacterium]
MEQLEQYNLIDMFVAVTLVVAFLLGLWKGFARTLAAVAGVGIGILAASRYHGSVEPYLSRISSLDPYICTILSMIILFIAVQAVFVLIRKGLDLLLDFTRLGWLDRILGAGLGVGAGFLFVATTVQLLVLAAPEWPAIKTSKLIPPIEQASRAALSRVPPSIRAPFQSLTTKWKGALDTNLPGAFEQSEPAVRKSSLIQGRVR